MIDILGVVLAAALLVSFVALFSYLVVAIGVSALTLKHAQRDRRLSDELDQVLVEILGPRSRPAATSWSARGKRL